MDRSDINQVVAQSLAYWMRERGMTAKDLGKIAGVSDRTVANFLKPGDRQQGSRGKPASGKLTELSMIAAGLGLDVAALVCVEMRGRNGFGGMVLEHITITRGSVDRSPKTWNTRCLIALNDLSHVGR